MIREAARKVLFAIGAVLLLSGVWLIETGERLVGEDPNEW